MPVAAAATVLVVGASLSGLLLYAPTVALARRLPRSRHDLRAGLYLTALVMPVALALATTAWGLARHLTHPLFSPHADRLRPHLCLRFLLDTPDGPFRARLVALIAGTLVLAALALMLGGWLTGAWEGARLARQARRREGPPWASGVALWEQQAGLASSRGLRPTVAVGTALGRLFPGAEGEAILAHEVAHARRRDPLWGPVAAALMLLQGLSPTAWALHRHWRREREAACDRYAAQKTSPEAVREALATAQALTAALEESSPLSPHDRHALTHLAWRAEALQEPAAEGGSPWAAPALVALVAAVVLPALLLVPVLRDSIHCAVEGLLVTLGR